MFSTVTYAGRNSFAFVQLVVVPHPFRISLFDSSLRVNFQNAFRWIEHSMRSSRRITSVPDSIAVF
jgi:hypothetical protein